MTQQLLLPGFSRKATDEQHREAFFKARSEGATLKQAAQRAGIHPRTGSRYLAERRAAIDLAAEKAAHKRALFAYLDEGLTLGAAAQRCGISVRTAIRYRQEGKQPAPR